jgi:hypothetical protein
MAERYFSPAEVEALIPALTEIMGRVMPAYAEVSSIRERLRAEQQRIALSGGGVIDSGGWRADRERLDQLMQDLQEGLDEVHTLGGVPKDLGLGLVDFLHLRGGHQVNLCWKYGEAKIGFWHALDEGFVGRKPL